MLLNNGISKSTKKLLTCGTIGSLLFITLFLVQTPFRQDYSPMKYAVSSLAIGELGWMQVANFITSGILILLFAIGFRRATYLVKGSHVTSRLIGISGIGLIGAGIFSSGPVYGYPATEPLALSQFTWEGHLHDAFSMLLFVCLPWACFRLIKRFKESGDCSWLRYSWLSVIAVLFFFVLAALGFKQVDGFVAYAGLFQRLSIGFGFLWLAALSVFVSRNSVVVTEK